MEGIAYAGTRNNRCRAVVLLDYRLYSRCTNGGRGFPWPTPRRGSTPFRRNIRHQYTHRSSNHDSNAARSCRQWTASCTSFHQLFEHFWHLRNKTAGAGAGKLQLCRCCARSTKKKKKKSSLKSSCPHSPQQTPTQNPQCSALHPLHPRAFG